MNCFSFGPCCALLLEPKHRKQSNVLGSLLKAAIAQLCVGVLQFALHIRRHILAKVLHPSLQNPIVLTGIKGMTFLASGTKNIYETKQPCMYLLYYGTVGCLRTACTWAGVASS